MGPTLQNHPITQFRGITTTAAAIACWAFSTIALAQSGNRGNFFVNVPDRNATIVVADGSNTSLVCADVEFIDSLTGQVRRGTGTSTSGCVGKLTSEVIPSCQAAGQQNCFITAKGPFVVEDIDSTALNITGVSLTAPSGTGAAGADTVLEFTVTTSEPITVTGTPTMGIKIGDTSRTATYRRGSGTASLVFGYTTVSGDTGPVSTPAGSTLALVNNATMGDAAGNTLALAFTPITTERTIDTTVPNVPTINSPANSGYFNAQISATINQPNTVLDTNFKDLRYTLNGVAPTCVSSDLIASQTGTAEIQTGANRTLKVIACDLAGNASSIATQVFTYDNTAPGVPTLSASATSFSATPFDITATKNDTSDPTFFKIRYNMVQGTTASSPEDCSSGTDIDSGGTITINTAITTTIAAIACDYAGNKSAPITATYTYGSSPSYGSLTGTPHMTSQSPERKSFYDAASAKHWVFWYEELSTGAASVNYGYYSTTTNAGQTTSTITLVGTVPSVSSPRFTVSSRGNYVLIAFIDTNNGIGVRRGTITSNENSPTINWDSTSAAAVAISASQGSEFKRVAMTILNNGDLCVGGAEVSLSGTTLTTLKTTKSTSSVLTGSTIAFDNPVSIYSGSSAVDQFALVSQASSAMALATIGGTLKSYVFVTPSTQGAEPSWVEKPFPATENTSVSSFSVASDNIAVRLAYIPTDGGLPRMNHFYRSNLSWVTSFALESDTNVNTGSSQISVSSSTAGDKLLITWLRANEIVFRTAAYATGGISWTWGNATTGATASGTDSYTFPTLPEVLTTPEVKIPIVWTKKSETSYGLGFMAVTPP